MATRRKYKASADAPVEIADVGPAPAGALSEEVQETAESPLIAQIAAAQRAEELQRQRAQQQPQTLEQYIDNLPDLSPHKRGFLKRYPVMLNPEVSPVMAKHYQAGLRSGLRDDTPELDQFLLVNVTRDLQHREQLAAAHAPPTQEAAQAYDAGETTADDLAREAEALYAEHHADAPTATPTPRRSIPVSAPVSRDVPSASGGRASSQNNTLSRDEREIARVSFPHLPARQAEFEYLKNRKRMHEMKANGYWDERR